MRMDVKFGFAIGFVLLAVLIVYVLVIHGGGQDRHPVELVTEGDGSLPAVTIDPPATQPVAITAPTGPGAAEPATPHTDPFASAPATPPSSPLASGSTQGVDWNNMLNGNGQAPTLELHAPAAAPPVVAPEPPHTPISTPGIPVDSAWAFSFTSGSVIVAPIFILLGLIEGLALAMTVQRFLLP